MRSNAPWHIELLIWGLTLSLAIIPIGDLKIQKMVLIERSVDNKIRQKELGEFRFVPLIGQDGWKKE